MSEETQVVEAEAEEPKEEPKAEATQSEEKSSSWTPPATEEEFERILGKRIYREREKYADYDQLKVKADELDGIVAQRDEWKERAEKAEEENGLFKQKEQKREWAQEVASEFGVPAEALRGETKEEMTAHAKTLEKYVKVSAPIVSGDGKSPRNQAGMATRDIFANALDGIL